MSALRCLGGLILLLLVAAPRALPAQSFRFRSVTTGRYIQLRPLVYDSATNTFTSGERGHAAPLTQDIEVNAWGFGVQGLRAYALVRLRTTMGSADLAWPRYDDHFDALWGFLELDRAKYRLRLGRLQRRSELGVYAFDGGLATVRPRPNLRFEVYGGRGLARGFLEPYRSGAISSLDATIPNTGSLLVGASAWVSAGSGSWLTALYQREITSDRSGFISERMAFNGETTAGRHLVFAGYADADLASAEWGKARLSAMLRLPRASRAEVAVYRYKPIIPLNTIWGVFSPESHRGFTLSADYAASRRLTLSASYDRRTYAPASETTPHMPNLSDRTETVTAAARWFRGDLQLSGQYHHTAGYGGGQSGGSAEVAYDDGHRFRVGAFGTGFQQAEEFRVAYGTVLGAGLNARAQIGETVTLRGQLARYWHTETTGTSAPNWGQVRAMIGAEVVFGSSADRLPGGVR